MPKDNLAIRQYLSSLSESAAGVTNRDTITDFQLDLGKLDLSAIDANPLFSLDQAFSFLGSSSTFTNVGQLRSQVSGGNLFLHGNIDASLATSEFELRLTGLAATSASNIIFKFVFIALILSEIPG